MSRHLVLLCGLLLGIGEAHAQQVDPAWDQDSISATSILQECPDGANLLESDTPDGFVQACLDESARQHGFSISWYENGNKKSQCGARHGKLWGKCTSWHENGKIKIEANYRDGLRQGRFTSWFANGQKRCQADYDRGVRIGTWKCWHPDGSPADEPGPLKKKALFPSSSKKFAAWLKEARRVPEALAEPGVLFGKQFLKKSAYDSESKPGRKSQTAGNKTLAPSIRRVWVLDADGKGLSRIAWVNRQGQPMVRRVDMRDNIVHNIEMAARRTSLCSFPARTDKPGLLYANETAAQLVGFDGKPRGKFDLPLANREWTSGVRGLAVKLRANRPAYMALAVSLRSFWRRSLLVIATPDGRAVYEEILPKNIDILGTAPSIMPGEEILLVGGENKVQAYGFDRDFYRTAFKRVIDVFRGNPNADNLLPVKPDNVASEVRDGWWNWTVFISGPPEALSRIDCVEYKLHASFPNPLRLVCRRGEGRRAFPLSMGGWGSFNIRVRMFLSDGPVQEMNYRLRLWQEK
jgi:hypothetical protein